ncbi:MAG: hypothetical protein WC712_10560 [Candidatus Brocadiia bacterium]
MKDDEKPVSPAKPEDLNARIRELETALAALVRLLTKKEVFKEEEYVAQMERTRILKDDILSPGSEPQKKQ